MTYRNDHDAALARVDALEHELAELRNRPTSPPPAPRPKSRARWFVACIAAAGGVFVGLTPAMYGRDDAAQAGEMAHVDRDRLAQCIEAIEPMPKPALTAGRTDPHGSASSVTPILATAAPCRDDLHAIITVSPLPGDERDALTQWVTYEDELAGAIARIETYYASDPYKLDNYASAPQLWDEFERAHKHRDEAMHRWRIHFQ